METTKTGQTLYMIIGVAGTGSGSLTWPEDFDIVGATFNEHEAHEIAGAMNKENGFVYDDDGDQDEDANQPDTDVREYYVETLDVLTRKG